MPTNPKNQTALSHLIILIVVQIAVRTSYGIPNTDQPFGTKEMQDTFQAQNDLMNTLISEFNCTAISSPDICKPCLQSLQTFFNSYTIPQVSNEQLDVIIDQKRGTLTSKQSQEAFDLESQCGNVKNKIELLLLQKSQINNTLTQTRITHQLEMNASKANLLTCQSQLQLCRNKTCPPNDCSLCHCPSTDCSDYIERISVLENQTITLNASIGRLKGEIRSYESQFQIWGQFFSQLIPQFKQQAIATINSKNLTQIQLSSLNLLLGNIQKITTLSSNATFFKENSNQSRAIVKQFFNEFLSFINSTTSLYSTTVAQRNNFHQNFKESLKTLKQCNDILKGVK